MPTAPAPAPTRTPLADATHLNLVVVAVPLLSRDYCYASCPTWLNDYGCDCPRDLPYR
jgi:hypothetical protein